jgi:hypothetical protein
MKSKMPSQLRSILDDIKTAISVKLYYPALLVALTIPDICSALEFEDDVFVKEKHYVSFVDKYTKPSELGLSGQECYRLRGGIVHRANAAGHAHFGSSHVLFTIPETKASIHALSLQVGEKKAAMFDLSMFCNAMTLACEAWFEDHQTEAMVIKNIPRLISMRPHGVAPFLGGAPVVGSGDG